MERGSSSGAGRDPEDVQARQANAVRRRVNRRRGAAAGGEGEIYLECRRNISLSSGRYSIDGCTEFVKAEGADRNPMLCVACGCHRSFHRKLDPYPYRIPAPPHYYGFLFNELTFVPPRARPQPRLPAPQPPLPPLPQPEMAQEVENEEETPEEESEEEWSEIDSECTDEDENNQILVGGEENERKKD